MLWIFATLVAAGAQTARNAMQSSLTATLGTLGATQVRFLYGLPFAVVFLALAAAIAGADVPAPTARFLAVTAGGAIAQIAGTALLLAAMQARSFSVATAFNKTEAVQVAIFGVVLLGEHLTLVGAGAIVIATAGVVLIAAKPGLALGNSGVRPVVFGIASGACFAIASVGFRGGILELGDGAYYLRAATTLVWALTFQALLLGAWMTLFARQALLASLALWRQSLVAGFFGAFASQFWFLGFSLTAAANVRALGLVEVVFAHVVAQRVFSQRATAREAAGMGLVVAGVALLLLTV
ncbi:MAG TPA: DMT family transporter [Gammaproteobacteria bacterium]|nr:DMT family transporter [Gammaproteobacteria bacterium]